MATNHRLATTGRKIVCDTLGIAVPVSEGAVGSMATIPLPGPAGAGGTGDPDPLTDRLRHEWNIEVSVFSWRDWPNRLLRLSAQMYNTESDYERLAAALSVEL